MGYIDCDSHVSETHETWDYLDPKDRHFRPRIVEFIHSALPGYTHGQFWVVGDTWGRFQSAGDGNIRENANVFSGGATQLTDLSGRIADLDALGIDVQLLLSTFFLNVELDNPVEEMALCRSYNRWLSEHLAGFTERLPWAMRVPMRSMSEVAAMLQYGKENGAVGVQVRGIEHGIPISDPCFYPLLEAAQDLDMAIFVHVGDATRRQSIPFGNIVPNAPAYLHMLYYLMAGFHGVIAADFERRFPRLRWGFLEGGCSWAPAVIQQHARLTSSGDEFLTLAPVTPAQLREKNIFIACEAEEDLPYLANLLGAETICAGTDYGHNDLGSELAAHDVITHRADVEESLARKITDTNGRQLLGVPADFTPAPAHNDLVSALPNVSGAGQATRPILRATQRGLATSR